MSRQHLYKAAQPIKVEALNMRDDIMKNIRENFGWIKDLVMVAGMCGVLYLNLNYVTNTKFDSFVKDTDARYETVQAAIVSIDKSLLLLQQNNKLLADLTIKVERIDNIQRDLVEQQKTDTAANAELHLLANKVATVDATVARFSAVDLSTHFKEEYQKITDIEYRLKAIESKLPVSPK